MPGEANPTELVKRLRDDVSRFADGAELADDITLMVLQWEGGSPALANVDLDAAVARL